MPYGRSRLTASAQLGDPFLGGIIRGIGRIASFVPGPIGAIGGAIAGIGARRGPPAFVGPPRPTSLRQVRPPAVMFPAASLTGIRGAPAPRGPRMPGDAPRRRRMNPLNVKALRRSTRRLAGFQREAKKVEKQLRKIAPQRRSSRRDLGPGHRHVR